MHERRTARLGRALHLFASPMDVAVREVHGICAVVRSLVLVRSEVNRPMTLATFGDVQLRQQHEVAAALRCLHIELVAVLRRVSDQVLTGLAQKRVDVDRARWRPSYPDRSPCHTSFTPAELQLHSPRTRCRSETVSPRAAVAAGPSAAMAAEVAAVASCATHERLAASLPLLLRLADLALRDALGGVLADCGRHACELLQVKGTTAANSLSARSDALFVPPAPSPFEMEHASGATTAGAMVEEHLGSALLYLQIVLPSSFHLPKLRQKKAAT